MEQGRGRRTLLSSSRGHAYLDGLSIHMSRLIVHCWRSSLPGFARPDLDAMGARTARLGGSGPLLRQPPTAEMPHCCGGFIDA
jgi:hypothetical protein